MSPLLTLTCSIALFCSVASASATPTDPCDLPVGVNSAISQKVPGAKVVHLADLNEYDRGLFTKDHGSQCPGLVEVNFYGDGKPTWVVVLISGEDEKRKAQLVVAHGVNNTWDIGMLDAADRAPVVWQEKPGKYDHVYGGKSIRATYPIVVFCGYESWAIAYSWNGKTVN